MDGWMDGGPTSDENDSTLTPTGWTAYQMNSDFWLWRRKEEEYRAWRSTTMNHDSVKHDSTLWMHDYSTCKHRWIVCVWRFWIIRSPISVRWSRVGGPSRLDVPAGPDAGWRSPTALTLTVIVTAGVLFAVLWSVIHCRRNGCQEFFHKEPLPNSLVIQVWQSNKNVVSD